MWYAACILAGMNKRMFRHFANRNGVLTRQMFPLALMHHMRASAGHSKGYGDSYIKHYAQRMDISLDLALGLANGQLMPTKKVLDDMNLKEHECECGSMTGVFYKLN